MTRPGRPDPAASPLTPGTPAARSLRVRSISGLLLAVLLLGHLLPVFVLGRGVFALDWNTLAARWAFLPSRIWDLLLLLSAAGHLGWLLLDRVRRDRERWFSSAVGALFLVALLLGGIFTVLTLGSDLR